MLCLFDYMVSAICTIYSIPDDITFKGGSIVEVMPVREIFSFQIVMTI